MNSVNGQMSVQLDRGHVGHLPRKAATYAIAQFAIQRGKRVDELTPEDYRQLLAEGVMPAVGGVMFSIPPSGPGQPIELEDYTAVQTYRMILVAGATAGDWWCARRLAELCEGEHDNSAAAWWWQRAVELGDAGGTGRIEALKILGAHV